MKGEPMKQYRALRGLTYPATKKDQALRMAGRPHEWKRVEPGEAVDNWNVSIPWLLDDGRIEEVNDGDIRV